VYAHVNRRSGTRPAPTVRSARVRGQAASEEAPRADAVRRLAWRVSAPKPTAAERRVAQGVAASRREDLSAPGCGRVQGRALSRTPWFVQYDHRGVGRLCLWSLAWRGLGWRPCVVRRHLQQAGAPLHGISPGPPGRQTAQPTTEMRRSVLRGVTLSPRKIAGQRPEHLTPLNAVPKRIRTLMEIPRESYDELVTCFSKTNVHSHET
jgi:hypothetical protein